VLVHVVQRERARESKRGRGREGERERERERASERARERESERDQKNTRGSERDREGERRRERARARDREPASERERERRRARDRPEMRAKAASKPSPMALTPLTLIKVSWIEILPALNWLPKLFSGLAPALLIDLTTCSEPSPAPLSRSSRHHTITHQHTSSHAPLPSDHLGGLRYEW